MSFTGDTRVDAPAKAALFDPPLKAKQTLLERECHRTMMALCVRVRNTRPRTEKYTFTTLLLLRNRIY